MTDWFEYTKGKAFRCPDCDEPVDGSETRWWNRLTKRVVCNACYRKKYASSSNPAIPLDNPSSSVVTPSSERITKAHDENMLSYELTRKCITTLTTSIDALTNEMRARTRVLEEQIKKGG